MRGWTGLSSFGSPVWLALSIVFGFGTAGERAAAQSTTADILGTVTGLRRITCPVRTGAMLAARRNARLPSSARLPFVGDMVCDHG